MQNQKAPQRRGSAENQREHASERDQAERAEEGITQTVGGSDSRNAVAFPFEPSQAGRADDQHNATHRAENYGSTGQGVRRELTQEILIDEGERRGQKVGEK